MIVAVGKINGNGMLNDTLITQNWITYPFIAFYEETSTDMIWMKWSRVPVLTDNRYFSNVAINSEGSAIITHTYSETSALDMLLIFQASDGALI